MKKIYHIPILLLSLLLITACSSEETNLDVPPLATTDKNVTLEIKIPGAKIPTSYGMTEPQEKYIKELTLFAYFKNAWNIEVLQEKIVATVADISNDGLGTLKIRLKIPAGNYHRLVLVANANTQADILNTNTGSPLVSLNDCLYTHATGQWDATTPDYIPMFGELKAGTDNGIEIKDGAWQTFKDIKLIRMLARVDIQNNASSTFELKEVMVFNMNRNGRIVANSTYWAIPARPNLPTKQPAISPMTYNYEVLKTGNAMNNEIFLFEAEAPVLASIATSPRIILKGIYEGTTYYYPVDFTYDGKNGTTKGSFMPIVRNHQYIFTISKVSGPGFATATDALATTNIFTNNIATQLKQFKIDDDFTDVYYDSDNFLAVNVSDAKINLENRAYTVAEATNTVTVLTDVNIFTIECYNADGTPTDTWLQPSAPSYLGNNKVDAFLKSANTGTKTGYIIVKAGILYSGKITITKN